MKRERAGEKELGGTLWGGGGGGGGGGTAVGEWEELKRGKKHWEKDKKRNALGALKDAPSSSGVDWNFLSLQKPWVLSAQLTEKCPTTFVGFLQMSRGAKKKREGLEEGEDTRKRRGVREARWDLTCVSWERGGKGGAVGGSGGR